MPGYRRGDYCLQCRQASFTSPAADRARSLAQTPSAGAQAPPTDQRATQARDRRPRPAFAEGDHAQPRQRRNRVKGLRRRQRLLFYSLTPPKVIKSLQSALQLDDRSPIQASNQSLFFRLAKDLEGLAAAGQRLAAPSRAGADMRS